MAEGDCGTAARLPGDALPAAGSRSRAYATAAGTATAGVDFGAVAGTVTFPAGSRRATVAVPVFGDPIDEPDETIREPERAFGRHHGDGQGQGTITDDDAAGLSISDAVVRERVAPNTAIASFEVTLSPASPGSVSELVHGKRYRHRRARTTGEWRHPHVQSGASSQTLDVTVNADAGWKGWRRSW